MKRIIDTGITQELLNGDNNPQLQILNKLYVVDDRQKTFEKIQEVQADETIDEKERTKKIYELEGIKTKVNPCTSEEFVRPAKRPKNSQMSKEKLLSYGIKIPTWEDALNRYLVLERKKEKEWNFRDQRDNIKWSKCMSFLPKERTTIQGQGKNKERSPLNTNGKFNLNTQAAQKPKQGKHQQKHFQVNHSQSLKAREKEKS